MALYFSTLEAQKFLENSGLSAIHFNARSLRKNYDDILAQLSSLNHYFSFICISETWLSPDDANLFCFPNYTPEYNNRTTSNHGGAAIFVASNINYKRRNDLHLSVEKCESVWIELDEPSLPTEFCKTIIGSIYRSPSSPVSTFCTELTKLLSSLATEKKSVVILGDMNINLSDERNPSCVDYTNCFLGFGYESLISIPTRCVLSTNGTIIDHILSNFIPQEDCGILEFSPTDHYPIFFRLDCHRKKQNRTFYKTVLNKEEFASQVLQADWSDVYMLTDAESAYNKMVCIVKECSDKASAVVKCNRKLPAPHSPWLTNGLLKSMRKKENMYKKTKKRPFNTKLKDRYKMYCNTLNRLLKTAKRRFYENKIDQAGNDVKQKWKIINNFLNNNAKHSPVTKLISSDVEYNDPFDIANIFNEQFCGSQHHTPRTDPQPLQRLPQSFFLFPTTPDEIIAIINNIKVTSAGLDHIYPSSVKLISHAIGTPFSHVINLMFSTGVFPQQLKKAKVIPVFKKGNRECAANYRPISILPFFSKVVEKCFVNRLMKYLSKFNILSPQQYGFRAGLSTDCAVLSFTDKIKTAIDSGCYAGALFVDLSKAFDSINHSILLAKLEAIGVVGPALTFISSYLSNRKQAVFISNVISSFKTTNKGVPQGSILGPILFLIYINDLPACLTSCEPFLYADDTTILSCSTSVVSVTSNLSNDFNNILLWCRNNCLHINATKTTFMVFHSHQKPLTCNPVILTNNHSIPMVNQCSFLGVVLDTHLKYTDHIAHVKRKAAFGIRILLKARPFFKTHTLISLYFAFVHSHFLYCAASWGNTYPTHLIPLQHLQNQAIRIITFSPYRTNASLLLTEYRILTVSNLVKFSLLVYLFKSVHNLGSFSIFNRDSLKNLNCTRFASASNLLLPKVRTNYGKLNTTFVAVNNWNSLPIETKQSLSLPSFKNNLRAYFLNQNE